ncbi:MAG: hypothetical protein R3B09_12940 [Nannocystaceae bacterium]
MTLPALQAGWIRAILGDVDLAVERAATCDTCSMCGEAAPPGGAFDPTTKCCTYVPALPNFLAGAILAATGPGSLSARLGLRARMADPRALTPHGVDPTPDEKSRYAALVAADRFGRDASLRCPHHLPDGGCGIWRHRNATCATWFCRHTRGATGERFWEALGRALTAIELELCHHLAREILDDTPATPVDDPEALPEWESWRGREEAYYRRAAARVAAMTPADVLAIAEPGAAEAIAGLRAAYAAWVDEPAIDRLVVGTFREVERRGGEARLLGYSEIDVVHAPAGLVDRLGRFDGRPTAAVADELAQEGVEVDPATLRRLVDFGVLVP